MTIANRLAAVRARIAAAATAAGRDPAAVRLIAVSKTFPTALVRDAYAAGQREFGENRMQEALQKIAEAADMDIAWHLLGHLQSNKARKAASAFSAVHSVDNAGLLQKLDAEAVEADRAPDLLLQVDLAGETSKFGARPGDLPHLLGCAQACHAARVVGLMVLPPAPDHPEDARPWFRRLRTIRDELLASGVPSRFLRELSMGMSGDFEIAIQEGATMVRVGTAIFGTRRPRPSEISP